MRDAFGAVPPGGVPQAFLEPVPDALSVLLRRHARTSGPFTTGEVAARFGLERERVESELTALERDEQLVRGELRPGGTEREWCDPGRAAPDPARDAGGAPARGRARGAGVVRALSPGLARDRPPADAARGARPVAGSRAAGLAVGERRAASAGARVPAGGPRRALRFRRRGVGRRGARPGGRVLPRGCPAPRAACGGGFTGGRGSCRRAGGARAGRALLGGPSRGGRAGCGRRPGCALGSRVGRRGHERLVGAASGVATLRGAAPGAWSTAVHALAGGSGVTDAGPLVAHGAGCSRRRPAAIAGRSRSSCSSGRGS